MAKQLDSAEDVVKALKLRIAGVSIRDIAANVGKSTGWVSQSIRKALRDIPKEEADAYRELMVSREEGIIAAHWGKRHEPEHAKVIQASDKILADLLGLDAPVRQELTANITSATPEEAARLVREAFGSHAMNDENRDAEPTGDGEVSPGAPES